ncbi:hypothetical protein OK074_5015 [Actinobacteria bacterium OK074]|nr:hypothetical protein OK074_5015 [Actinobacteria bacterium OK074]
MPAAPLPVPDLDPYLTALAAAETPAEFSAVTNSFLDAVEPLLNPVIDFLAAAAQWRGQNRGAAQGSPPWLLRDAASRISAALAMATHADLQILRAHYDPPRDTNQALKTRTSHGTPPAAPPPAAQPGPGAPGR